MPSGPSLDFLRRLGLNIPQSLPPLSEEEQRMMDEYALAEQEKLAPWQKFGGKILDILYGAGKGLVGAEPKSIGEAGPEDYSNLVTQFLTAGLPFAAFKKAKGIKEPFVHGTRSVFERFDPKEYDVNDVLGWMTHSARPQYAEKYALGQMKGKPDAYRPRMIPLEPEAKNVLDLVDPNPDDFAQFLAQASPEERKRIIRIFRDVKSGRRAPEEFVKSTHLKPEKTFDYGSYGSIVRRVPRDNPATRAAAEQLRLSPEDFKKSPFDAYYYHDVDEQALATPVTTPIKTPWGVDLTPEVIAQQKPIKVIRSDVSGGGELSIVPTEPSIPSYNEITKLYNDIVTKLNTEEKITGDQVLKWLNKYYPIKEQPTIKSVFTDEVAFNKENSALTKMYDDKLISGKEYDKMYDDLFNKYYNPEHMTGKGSVTKAYSPEQGITSVTDINDVPGNFQQKLNTIDKWLDNGIISNQEHAILEKQFWELYDKSKIKPPEQNIIWK